MIVESSVVALRRRDVDTDQIIPAHRLTGVSREGCGEHLFGGLPEARTLIEGAPGAAILIAHHNFGCGSSREHAAWALYDRGFRAVVAPSFARLFEENAYNNGIAPIVVDEEHIERLFAADSIRIDLVEGRIETGDGAAIAFELDALRKRFILEGGYLDFLASKREAVRAWERSKTAAAGLR
jgi:3-isopropylmalate/(R)-2-methylmalate dehydratase small subunit